jgi:DNA-binding beta-propeller fold protein YncE
MVSGPQIIVITLFAMGCSGTKSVDSEGLETGDSGHETGATPCESLSGTVCRVAGTGSAGAINAASLALESPLYAPMDVAFFTSANDFLIADWNNHKIRRVQDGFTSTVIGTAFLGDGDPDFQERIAPGVDGTTVALNHPTSMEWSEYTNKWLIPSWHNHRLREWDPDTGLSLVVGADTDITDGNGANSGFAGDGGPAANALMSYPNSIAVHPETGDFWLLDQRNNRIRAITADFTDIQTIAGGDDAILSGDGGPAQDGRFYFWNPEELQPEPSGAIEYDSRRNNLYIADTSNHRIRVIDLDTGTIDSITTTGEQTLPDGECDPDALCYPRDLELLDDDLYIADTNNHVIRRLNLETHEFEVVVGSFESGETTNNTAAMDFRLNTPHGIDVEADGTLIIADTYNHQILKVFP